MNSDASFIPTKQRKIANGYLYAMSSAFTKNQNIYKIGVTESLEQRMKQYATYHLHAEFVATCPPLRNPNEKWCTSKNEPETFIDLAHYREATVFVLLAEYRLQDNHEFFHCDLGLIQSVFETVQVMSCEQLANILNIPSTIFNSVLSSTNTLIAHIREWIKQSSSNADSTTKTQEYLQFLQEKQTFYEDKIKLVELQKENIVLKQSVAQLELKANSVYAEMEVSKKYHILAKKYQELLATYEALQAEEEADEYMMSSDNSSNTLTCSDSSSSESESESDSELQSSTLNANQKQTTKIKVTTLPTNNANFNTLIQFLRSEYQQRYQKQLKDFSARTYVYALEGIRRVLNKDEIINRQMLLENVDNIIQAAESKEFKTRNNWMCAIKLVLHPTDDAEIYDKLKRHLYAKK